MDRAGPPPKDKVEALKVVARNAGVNKTQLQSLCTVNGLPKTGNKPDLVKRLVDGEYALTWPSFEETTHRKCRLTLTPTSYPAMRSPRRRRQFQYILQQFRDNRTLVP